MSLMLAALTGSSPAVGSSMKTSLGLLSSPRTKFSRACMPLEYSPTRLSASASRPTICQQPIGLLGVAAVERAEVVEVLAAGQAQVVVGQLEGDADLLVQVRAPGVEVAVHDGDCRPGSP